MNDERYNRKRARGQKKQGEYTPPPFIGFLDPYLSPAELEKQKEMQLSAEEGFDSLLKFIEEGFSLKFSYDDNNCCHQVTATPKKHSHPYAGMYLVGRGSEPLKALKQLLFKHYHILDGIWSIDFVRNMREDYE
mgnify:FL=1